MYNKNSSAHTSMLMHEYLVKNKIVLMQQPPYLPDLASAYSFLFIQKLKTSIKGKHFPTIDWVKKLIFNSYSVSVKVLPSRAFTFKKIWNFEIEGNCIASIVLLYLLFRWLICPRVLNVKNQLYILRALILKEKGHFSCDYYWIWKFLDNNYGTPRHLG